MARSNSKSLAQPSNDWRVESDLSTLMDAEKIKADQKRWTAARALAKQRILDAAKVASDDDAPAGKS